MKTALIQCDSVPGDLAGNAARILTAAHTAQGADLCVFPAAALCGVGPAAYRAREGFPRAVDDALDRLAAENAGGPALLLARPGPKAASEGAFADTPILVENGAWRELAPERGPKRGQNGDNTPPLLTRQRKRFGVLAAGEALSDAAVDRARAMALDGLIVMNASQWRPGIQRERETELARAAAALNAFVFAVNTVGGNDCAVFNGQSTAFDPAGKLIGRAVAFAEDVLVVDDAVPEGRIAPPCACEEEETWKALVLGTRDFVRKCGAQKVLVGLSGGVDSALVCCIAAEALGAENVIAVRMPSPYSSRGSLDDAAALAENLGIPAPYTIPIAPAMTAFSAMLAPAFADAPAKAGDVTFENLQARIRGVVLNALANRLGALILNTG
ncbi:MAG: NAD(+) synthase, partial [Desulfovibrio sp.]|nr:NAD(+) synthase [Desulfovibrio sp.]